MVTISTIYSELNKNKYKNSIITIGSFDGMHLGHQKIFNRMDFLSLKYQSSNKILITFDPHPYSVLNKNNKDRYYLSSSLDDRIDTIKNLKVPSIDIMVVISFNKKLSFVSASNFFEQIIASFNPIAVVMGYDNGFGYKREGNIRFLKKKYNNKNFEIHEINPKKDNDKSIVSSTLIRQLISNGEIKRANLMLGRNYSLIGTVVKGYGIGKKINFPTININPLNKYQIIPLSGVYFVRLEIDTKKFTGMCNIGFRPTLTNSKEETIEIHIFRVERNKDFYNKRVKVFFLDYIRKEKNFKSTNFLIKQLEKDKEFCLSIKV